MLQEAVVLPKVHLPISWFQIISYFLVRDSCRCLRSDLQALDATLEVDQLMSSPYLEERT